MAKLKRIGCGWIGFCDFVCSCVRVKLFVLVGAVLGLLRADNGLNEVGLVVFGLDGIDWIELN